MLDTFDESRSAEIKQLHVIFFTKAQRAQRLAEAHRYGPTEQYSPVVVRGRCSCVANISSKTRPQVKEEEALKMVELHEERSCQLVRSFKHLCDVSSTRHRDKQSYRAAGR